MILSLSAREQEKHKVMLSDDFGRTYDILSSESEPLDKKAAFIGTNFPIVNICAIALTFNEVIGQPCDGQ
jgi:hypothetical protein